MEGLEQGQCLPAEAWKGPWKPDESFAKCSSSRLADDIIAAPLIGGGDCFVANSRSQLCVLMSARTPKSRAQPLTMAKLKSTARGAVWYAIMNSPAQVCLCACVSVCVCDGPELCLRVRTGGTAKTEDTGYLDFVMV